MFNQELRCLTCCCCGQRTCLEEFRPAQCRLPLLFTSRVSPPDFWRDSRFQRMVQSAASCVACCTLQIKSRVCCVGNQPEEGSCRRRWESSCGKGIEEAEQDRSAGPFLRGETNMPSSHPPIKKYNYERCVCVCNNLCND